MEKLKELQQEAFRIEAQIKNIHSHEREMSRFIECINAGTYSGQYSGDLEKIKHYFRSIFKQLEDQMDQLASQKAAIDQLIREEYESCQNT